jgi:hypothetical protein
MYAHLPITISSQNKLPAHSMIFVLDYYELYSYLICSHAEHVHNLWQTQSASLPLLPWVHIVYAQSQGESTQPDNV